MTDEDSLTIINRELTALRKAQLLLNGSPTASMADKRRITDRVMELIEGNGLIPQTDEDTTASPTF